AGRKVLPRRRRQAVTGHEARVPFGRRWALIVLRHRVPALLACLVVIAVAAVPALDLRLALPDDSTAAATSTQRKAYDQLAEGFGPGFNGPLIVVVETAAGKAEATAT